MIGSGSATRFPVVGENVNNMEDIFAPTEPTSMGLDDGEPPMDCATYSEAGTDVTELDAARDSAFEISGDACDDQPNELWLATWRTGVGDEDVDNLDNENANETTDDSETFGNNSAVKVECNSDSNDMDLSLIHI